MAFFTLLLFMLKRLKNLGAKGLKLPFSRTAEQYIIPLLEDFLPMFLSLWQAG